jgi:putative ABC transport system ATP-binding protein
LSETCRKKGVTVFVITHNTAIAPMADRVIKIRNGRVESAVLNKDPESIDGIEW